MTVKIRDAQGGDAARIREVLIDAFPTPAEARLVEELERDGDVLLSLVAVRGGDIAGHVLFSRMVVESDEPARAASLAPVAVTSPMQGQGIGSALIRAGLDRLREAGVDLVFVLGEPRYYRRFGFDTALAGRYASPYAGDYFMALAFDATKAGGTAHHAPAFARLGDEE